MKYGKLTALSALLTATLVVTGCGSADGTGTESGSADAADAAAVREGETGGACELLTAADLVEVEAKDTYGKGYHTELFLDDQACWFKPYGGQSWLELRVTSDGRPGSTQFDELREEASDHKPLSGVGDGAISDTSQEMETIVVFYKGDKVGKITRNYMGGAPDAQKREADIVLTADLAKRVIARL
ncbi:hypothetical protein [Actinoplanes sp. NPDC049118]|uniref:hypothetical protein n=1 Tax=Actinoplanes sp. NPDC049118 TaxID=3155769 RepID=UPI0033FCAA6B